MAALKRRERQEKRRGRVKRLETINESSNHRPDLSQGHNACTTSRNVILHLTGGGFFAHTIASDLPYLLEWSAKTGAVVVCPEYALLPENTFPIALNQVSRVYCALVEGSASRTLGFDIGRIVVSGESSGGNLAASLCVKLCSERKVSAGSFTPPQEISQVPAGDYGNESVPSVVRLPDALMLSCAALNLSLDVSPSRVIGNQDPVLPTGLISAISDAYLPGINKKDPLASPLFAHDDVLKLFPPTLMFASSEDPLLDDSVDFNQRLRSLGVHSDLRATHNLPHAYWGLGTAGFPEAQQVQIECEAFLEHQFSRNDSSRA